MRCAALLRICLSLIGFVSPIFSTCTVEKITRSPDDLTIWSPIGDRYLVNKKDAIGTYQLYVGSRNGQPPVCITCADKPNGPSHSRHKLQPRWHPSGEWIVLAGERDTYKKPLISTPDLIEGWIQSGLWVNIYVTRPDGNEWYRLSDFGVVGGEGFTGVAFTPDGAQAVWAQIVSGDIRDSFFGRWELILATFAKDENGVPRFSNIRDITPEGAKWIEPGNFSPDGKSLLITADVGLRDQQGMDQYILDISTGKLLNLTNTPDVWDEHGVFSPDGEKVLFMSSLPFRADRLANTILFLKTEFMMMNKDGSGLQQITHFNTPGFSESNPPGKGSVAAIGGWLPDGTLTVLNLFFPIYQTWNIVTAKSGCGITSRSAGEDFIP